MAEEMRMDDYILQFIPTGSRNAIAREYLRTISGIPDRSMREFIEAARQKIPIINLSDGNGYYIPDMNDEMDVAALKKFHKQEKSREDSLHRTNLVIEETLKNCGY